MALTLDVLRGRIHSHRQVPTPRWDEELGERGRSFRARAGEMLAQAAKLLPPDDPSRITIERSDDSEISQARLSKPAVASFMALSQYSSRTTAGAEADAPAR